MSEKLIGIDVGGTSARVAEFSGSDSDAIERQDRFQISGRYSEDIKRLTETINGLLDQSTPAGIGLAVAGELNEDKTALLRSANIRGWAEQPLHDDLTAAFHCEVRLLNDADAAALAEAVFGDHTQNFWFLTWGTGVGGSVVEFGPDGPRVVGGEPGHHIIRWDESSPECACGRHGCIEAFVGGAGIEKRFGKPAAEISEMEWSDVEEWMARGIYNLIRAYPVDEVVIGGGIAVRQSTRLPSIEARVRELKFPNVTVRLAKHGEEAGMIGAIAALRPAG